MHENRFNNNRVTLLRVPIYKVVCITRKRVFGGLIKTDWEIYIGLITLESIGIGKTI